MIINVGEMLVKNTLETIEERRKVLSRMNMNGYDNKYLQQQLLSATNTIDTIIDGYQEQGLITAEQYNTLDDALDKFADIEF